MPKSARSVVAALGIMRAGAAYVPVDPNAPTRRAAFILNDCGVRGIVTTARKLLELEEFLPALESLELIVLADDQDDVTQRVATRDIAIFDWESAQQTDASDWTPAAGIESDPAYLLYTSGSTGNPKGVILSHRHALTFVEWGAETFGVGPDDRLSNHAPLHFDLSIFDIYVALRCGACVVLVPDQIALFPVELARWIEAERITVWYSVPSALTRILLHGRLERFDYANLRTVLFAGEVFPVKYLRRVMEKLQACGVFQPIRTYRNQRVHLLQGAEATGARGRGDSYRKGVRQHGGICPGRERAPNRPGADRRAVREGARTHARVLGPAGKDRGDADAQSSAARL